ncbi:MAG: amidohydrolase family protein, partial [Candidatus Hodarchaeota archaeon]
MEYNVVIKGGSLVIPETGVVKADVGIQGEKIVCVGSDLPVDGAKVIDAKGKFVFPGLIDPHTHIGHYIPLKEDLLAESKGAAAGGVTTLLSTLRVLSNPAGPATAQKERTFESYKEFFPKAQKVLEGPHTYIDYSWHFCLTSLEDAERADTYYQKFGIQSYKFYMAYTRRAASPGMNVGQLYAILQMWSKLPHHPL